MAYQRRLLRYGPSPDELLESLDERAIAGCRFTLERVGGCGAGQLKLRDAFADRAALTVGTWIACEYADGDRWYLGQIVERVTQSPAGITLQLAGLSQQLQQVFPGGFGVDSDDPPHRYALTDLFSEDPDRALETLDVVERPEDIVRLLLSQYVVSATSITYVPELVENADVMADVASLKFYGEESVSSILKDLALRVQHAAWGVNEAGQFYFLPERSTLLMTCQESVDAVELRESVSHDQIFNRVLLTGGYIYGPLGTARWRANYRQPASIATYGERRIKIWVPWIRTSEDSQQFVREFFDVYAQPTNHFRVTIANPTTCPWPWLGCVRLLDSESNELITAQPERVIVEFDHTPVLTFELGPDDPRKLWPSPPHEERYPRERLSEFDLTDPPSDFGSSSDDESSGLTSTASSSSDDMTTSSGSWSSSEAGSDAGSSAASSSAAESDSGSDSSLVSSSMLISDASSSDMSFDSDSSSELPPPWSGPGSSGGGGSGSGGSGWSGTGSL
ncbi:hypothetical protein GC163_07825 [bacterium]|nr:hypothetical protein [bacterium]